MDPKRWADHRKLYLDMKLAGFVAWRDRALWLLGSRTPGRTQVVAVGGISESPHQLRNLRVESLNMIMSDSLLSRTRECEDGRGLESSCGENSMRSGVEARHRSFQQKP